MKPAGAAFAAALVLVAAVVSGCGSSAEEPPPPPPPPTSPPEVAEYDLGAATIMQPDFEEGDPFREMPVQLNGVIGVPTGGGGPFPVVLILHGAHPGCPTDESGVDRWPCDPDVEQRNFSGFEYLVSDLAARGYVALAPNINAEYTLGFGEAATNERLRQLVDLHLTGLAAASSGEGEGSDGFGVEVADRADLGRLVLFGHSRGGDSALTLANAEGLQEAENGYGPVAGVLQISAAAFTRDPWEGSSVPLATVLAACDSDVVAQDGQLFYEGIRLAGQDTWAASAWLDEANHNNANSALGPDPFGLDDRPDCDQILEGSAQRDWLTEYAADFLTVLFYDDATAAARMGLDPTSAAPDSLYGLPARIAYLPPAAERRTLFVPAEETELTTNAAGGEVSAEGVTMHFCEEGYYTPEMQPGSEPCRRSTVTIPGQPALAVVSWEDSGAALRFAVPEEAGDASGFTALTLRAAVDPMSPLNEDETPQALTVRLTDRDGNTATVATRADEPALRAPVGLTKADEVIPDGYFTGRVPLTAIRMPLADFSGIDTSGIAEVALVFDRSPSGTIYLADLAWA